MAPNSVVITGAFGQIGRRCAEILLSRGRTVVGIDLRNDNTVAVAAELAQSAAPGGFVPAYIDLRDAAAVEAVVAEHRPQAIVHLAAILAPASYRNPALAREVNVGGTQNLIAAATSLAQPPLFVYASSAAVYGSRNPYRHPELITADTPVQPIDQYGQDKVLAEAAVRESGLPYALLRLGGVISPDAQASFGSDHLTLMAATPRDNRMHAVDARDVALAFANAVDRADAVNGRVLLIGGNDSYMTRQHDLQDDLMSAMGVGRLGPSSGLPGDPADDRGWSFTGWFDTSESQALLEFQEHTWAQTLEWIADSQGRVRMLFGVASPVIPPLARLALAVQRRLDRRGRYADPWRLIEKKYGGTALAESVPSALQTSEELSRS